MSRLLGIKGFLPYIVIVFLNAFIDLGHKIIVQNTVFKLYDGQTQIILTAVVNALILIPFILLFSPAGYFSDKYPKNRVMQLSAWAAVAITLLITACYYAGLFWCAFALTLLLATQSAFYSPAKYGYIKELVGIEPLARANGVVQAVTITAILLGTFVFSALFEALLYKHSLTSSEMILENIAPVGWILVALSIVELILTYQIPEATQLKATQSKSREVFLIKQYLNLSYLKDNLHTIKHSRTIWLSIVGLATFWAISQVVLASFPAFAKATLNETNTLVIQGILACAGIGIILGSTLAGRVSRSYIEIGLVPVGAAGVTLTLLLIPTLESTLTLSLAFIALGASGGIFIIPLNALIQYHARQNELGTVLAGNNWVQNVAMLAFLIVTAIFAGAGLDTKALFAILAVVSILGAGYTLKKLPHAFVRIIVTFLFKQRYNIAVSGFHHLPASGPVLLLGNHISWIDWALIQIACPRPVRFVMERSIFNRWYLKPILSLLGVIPISAGKSTSALSDVNKRLKMGEVVCLFPEGAISRNGQLGKFHTGYERTVDGVDGGIILPFYLRGLWGSKFSRSSEKLRKSRTPRRTRRDIIVAFGDPLPLDTPADHLKQQVFELSVTAWETYTNTLDTIPLAWIKIAKRYGKEICSIDQLSGKITYRRMLVASLMFSRIIRKQSSQQNIGILLPASNANIITNLAVMLNGYKAVNLNYTASPESFCAGLEMASIGHIYTSKRFVSRLEQRGIDCQGLLLTTRVHYLEDLLPDLSAVQKVMTLVATWLPPTWIYRMWGTPKQLDDPAAIIYSSGSEGQPKGIVLSHRNIIANCKQISDVLNTREDDVMIGSLPPFHSFGLTVTTILPLLEGIPVVCHPDPADVLNIAKSVARYRATILLGTATFLRLYAKNSRVHPLMMESLRIVVAGAEKLTETTRNAFETKFNKPIYEGYGATETTPVASVNVPDALDINSWRIQHGNRHGTVGLPLPGSSFRIVDPDTRETLPLGQEGLILVSGTQVMLGYLNDADKTDDVIFEQQGRRWYKTGDKGYLTPEGFLVIVDRYSRFAKIGGEMISLGAVEEKSTQLLQQEEGRLAAVAIPDERKGEKIILLTEMTDTTDTNKIRQQLIQGGMNSLMLPSSIIAVDEIPKLGSGKADYKQAENLAKENMV